LAKCEEKDDGGEAGACDLDAACGAPPQLTAGVWSLSSRL